MYIPQYLLDTFIFDVDIILLYKDASVLLNIKKKIGTKYIYIYIYKR